MNLVYSIMYFFPHACLAESRKNFQSLAKVAIVHIMQIVTFDMSSPLICIYESMCVHCIDGTIVVSTKRICI